jgi:hypothetical protein
MDKFGKSDQLYAYWVTMLAGADAYCYGAHGVWNAGDGVFLSHWGKQTLSEALALDTPRLIGISHELFVDIGLAKYSEITVHEEGEELVSIGRSSLGKNVVFYPDVSRVEAKNGNDVRIFDPLIGKFVKKLPDSGQVVLFYN